MPAIAWGLFAIVSCAYAVHATVLLRRLGVWKTDDVTGLPVRAAFMRQARRTLRRPGTVVIFADMDRFKPINEVHGHPFADRVLGEVADRLRAFFGPAAVIGRLGGDEYAIVTQLGAHSGPWQETLDTMRGVIAAPMDLPGGPRIQVTAAVGAVHLNGSRRPALSAALNQAEACMRTSKHRRSGLTCYTAKRDEPLITTPTPTHPPHRLRDQPSAATAG